MKKSEKKTLLITNLLYWAAAIFVPPLLNLIPTSHPPRILPLFIYMFLFALAGLSTFMWSRALGPLAEESE